MPPMYEPAIQLIGYAIAAFIVASIPVLVGWRIGGMLHAIKQLIIRLWD
jgi:hypothetical protein